MKLRYSPNSPFVRKVTIAAIETGLNDRIERVTTDYTSPGSDLGADNPLGKVPTLILDDGEVIIDSPVICAYLDTLHDGPKLFPAEARARRHALYLQALGDGITQAAVLRMHESRRPEAERRADVEARQKVKVDRALDHLESHIAWLDQPLAIGHIAIACALGFLDDRIKHDPWRAKRPLLARWFDAMSKRPSLRSTLPLQAPAT